MHPVISAIATNTNTTTKRRSTLSLITPKQGPAIKNIQEAAPVSCTHRGEWVASFT
jgi:hypothetical protein